MSSPGMVPNGAGDPARAGAGRARNAAGGASRERSDGSRTPRDRPGPRPPCVPKPRSAVPGETRLGASRGAARTAQADVRVPPSQGVPSADCPGVSRGRPVRRPPGAGGSGGSGDPGAVVERAQACGASAEWPQRAEQRRGRGRARGSDGATVASASGVTGAVEGEGRPSALGGHPVRINEAL